LCCDCCKKLGLQDEKCKKRCLEFDLFAKGKKLNRNEEKGVYLERATSNTLKNLGIPHKHNPFKLYYSHYQGKNPDIIIEKINGIIECKNLNQKQIDLLSTQWLDKNVVHRPKTAGYNLRIALFSYKPRKPLVNYLKRNGWKTYGVGFQILKGRQEAKASRKLKQHFWWFKNLYKENQWQKTQ